MTGKNPLGLTLANCVTCSTAASLPNLPHSLVFSWGTDSEIHPFQKSLLPWAASGSKVCIKFITNPRNEQSCYNYGIHSSGYDWFVNLFLLACCLATGIRKTLIEQEHSQKVLNMHFKQKHFLGVSGTFESSMPTHSTGVLYRPQWQGQVDPGNLKVSLGTGNS